LKRFAWILFVPILLLGACAPSDEETAYLSKKALLTRQNQGIRELIAEAEKGTLVPVDQFLVGIDESVVADLLRFALPLERPLGDKLILHVDKVDVQFRDKYGVITVEGSVNRPQTPDRRIAIRAHGGLGDVTIDPATERLSIKIAIDDIQLLEAGILEGVLGRGGKSLVATRGKKMLEDALPTIQVPVGLAHDIKVPAIQSGAIALDSLTVPLDLSVKRVIAAGRKLWVTLDAQVGDIQGADEGVGVRVAKKKKKTPAKTGGGG
jgi:hypothetical protein